MWPRRFAGPTITPRDYGGDPNTLFVMGHSAGAQLAALVCTDERYLKAEKLSFAIIKGCVPVDGDTYDLPMRIATVHKSGNKKLAERDKQRFGDETTPEGTVLGHVHCQGQAHSAVPDPALSPIIRTPGGNRSGCSRHCRKRACPPNLSAEGKNHTTINDDLGVPGDKPTQALFEFLSEC